MMRLNEGAAGFVDRIDGDFSNVWACGGYDIEALLKEPPFSQPIISATSRAGRGRT